MKIDNTVISIPNNDRSDNSRIRKLLFENNIPHSIGGSSKHSMETIDGNTTMTIEFFTLYKFNSENDAVEFKLKYM